MRILLVETASPKRIYHKIEEIRQVGSYPDPEMAILCREDHCAVYENLSGVNIYPLLLPEPKGTLAELNQRKFDLVVAFWTGEKKYNRMKLLALRLRARSTLIIGGDGNEFRLTWKSACRHALFRWKHPLPTDHWDFASQPSSLETGLNSELFDEKEQVLVIQSAEPIYVLKALDTLKEKSPFQNASYSIFCRNRPEAIERFKVHPMISRLLVHSESRNSMKHLKNLRRIGFDSIVLLMTGDPSYRKVKFFAFLLGVSFNRILIFNEALDCFFFDWNQWFGLIFRRLQAQSCGRRGLWHHSTSHLLISLILKSALLPFRFVWLLFVWLRLRLSV
jgi:hypothetical protein